MSVIPHPMQGIARGFPAFMAGAAYFDTLGAGHHAPVPQIIEAEFVLSVSTEQVTEALRTVIDPN
ncbi:hypothetical protein, partial [Cupriavidus necator]